MLELAAKLNVPGLAYGAGSGSVVGADMILAGAECQSIFNVKVQPLGNIAT